MKETDCKISDAEWVIMKVLWNKYPLTTTSIIETLKPGSKWKPKTIHSLINRLVKKGALGINKDNAQYEFYPLVAKENCVIEETRSFMKKVYDGSFHLMLANFIKDENISNDEIERLKDILDEKLK